MKRRTTVLFALLATCLVVLTALIAGAQSERLAVGSEHSDDAELGAGQLTNATVVGAGESAYVAPDTSVNSQFGDEEDGDLSEYTGNTGQLSLQSGLVGGSQHSIQMDTGGTRDETQNDIPTSFEEYSFSFTDVVGSLRSNNEILFTDGGTVIWGFFFKESEGGLYWSDATERTNGQLITSLDETAVHNVTIKNIDTTNDEVDIYVNGSFQGTYSFHNPGDSPDSYTLAANAGGGSQGFRVDTLNGRSSGFSDGETAIYVGAPHAVTNAAQGFADLVLSNATATVTWEENTTSGWQPVNSSTFTTTGNHTLALTGASNDSLRPNVTFEATGSNPTAELDAEGILFTDHAATADNASANPSATSTNNENVTLSVPISDPEFGTSQGDSVTVEFYLDGNLIDTQTVTSNGTVSTTATGLADGAHTWHVELTDSYGLSSTSSTFSFEVLHYAPVIDNGSATPRDGVELTNRTVEFSILANDTDFDESSGDEVAVEFYLDGGLVDTVNLTANGTASTTATVSTGGVRTWHAEATDEYGFTTSSDPFTFALPSTLYVHNESNTSELVDSAEVVLRFYGANNTSRVYERTATDGKINMTGLPIDEEFIVIARAPGYYDRRVHVRSLYEQSRIYLLPENETAVFNVFTLVDRSGTYPAGETRLIIQRALNVSGMLQWQTVAGDFFGATNEFPIYLRYNQRYNLIIENADGDRRDIGSYVAADENNPKPVQIKSIIVDPPEGQEYYGTAWIEDPTDNDGEKDLRFTYTDPAEQTSSITLRIYERGNQSHELVNKTVPVSGTSYAYTYTLNASKGETEVAWQVEWSADRADTDPNPGGSFPIGQTGSIPIPMDPEWLVRFGIVALPVVAAMAGERWATYGAIGCVVFAGLLAVTGIWQIPVVLWIAGLVIALGGHALTMARRGAVFG